MKSVELAYYQITYSPDDRGYYAEAVDKRGVVARTRGFRTEKAAENAIKMFLAVGKTRGIVSHRSDYVPMSATAKAEDA